MTHIKEDTNSILLHEYCINMKSQYNGMSLACKNLTDGYDVVHFVYWWSQSHKGK